MLEIFGLMVLAGAKKKQEEDAKRRSEEAEERRRDDDPNARGSRAWWAKHDADQRAFWDNFHDEMDRKFRR